MKKETHEKVIISCTIVALFFPTLISYRLKMCLLAWWRKERREQVKKNVISVWYFSTSFLIVFYVNYARERAKSAREGEKLKANYCVIERSRLATASP